MTKSRRGLLMEIESRRKECASKLTASAPEPIWPVDKAHRAVQSSFSPQDKPSSTSSDRPQPTKDPGLSAAEVSPSNIIHQMFTVCPKLPARCREDIAAHRLTDAEIRQMDVFKDYARGCGTACPVIQLISLDNLVEFPQKHFI